VPVLERGEAGDVLVLDVVALRAEPGDGCVPVTGAPQHHGVEDRAEGGVASADTRSTIFP
jgi:hypothetical protein